MAIKYFTARELDKGINKQFPSTMVLWADGRNVRFTPGYVSKTLGKGFLASATGGMPVRAIFTFVGTDGAVRSIVCCDSAVLAYNVYFTPIVSLTGPSGPGIIDFAIELVASQAGVITPSPAPTGGASDVWQFELVAGLPILSNGKDAIWKWPSYAGVLVPLIGAPTWAKRISNCMHRLVASNLEDGGNAYTGRVKWTEPGNPENWTIDTTGKAGRFDIVGYNTGVAALANIKSQVAGGSKMFFFTERGLWLCDYAQAVKQFVEIDPDAEILSPMAACWWRGHVYYLGKKDVYRTTGGISEPIGLPIRDDLFGSLNASCLSTAFVFPVPSKREIWFCVATGSNTSPDTAYIFNEELKVWSIEDVNFLCHGEVGFEGIPYDAVGTAQGNILRLDAGFNDNGVAIDGVIETGDLTFELPDVMKKVSEVIPDLAVQGTVSELMVQVGVRNRLADDIKWSDPVAFTIGVSERCDFSGFRKEGKIVRLRFYSDQKDAPWSLAGFTVKYETGGTR